MASATNLAVETVINSEPVVKDSLAKPLQSTDKERVHTTSLPDDLKVLHDGINKYSSINEHGKGVWVVTDIKKRIDDLNYRTGKKVSIRAFTNAALDFVLSMYGEEIIKVFSQD